MSVLDAARAPVDSRAATVPSRTRVRVAYCIENLGVSGGTESNAVRTMEGIDRSRVDVVVVAIGPDGPMRARYERAGHTVHRFPISPLWHPRTYLQVLRLAAFFRRERVEIVHTNCVYTNWIGMLAGRLALRPKLIASKRWTTELDRFLPFTKLSFRMADRVLGNSALIAESAVTVEGADRSKLLVIPNFLDKAAFEQVDAPARAAWRQQLGLSPDAVIVGCVQRLRPEKDHARVIRAFASLRVPDRCELVFVGDGPEESRLRALIGELPDPMRERVKLVGHLPNRPSPHQLFDISVLPAISEGFPNSLLEAMAVGRAVVSTDVGGVRDAIEHERSGLVVAPGNDAELRAALQRLIDEPETRARLGAAALHRATTVFTVERVLPALADAYDAMMAGVRQ